MDFRLSADLLADLAITAGTGLDGRDHVFVQHAQSGWPIADTGPAAGTSATLSRNAARLFARAPALFELVAELVRFEATGEALAPVVTQEWIDRAEAALTAAASRDSKNLEAPR